MNAAEAKAMYELKMAKIKEEKEKEMKAEYERKIRRIEYAKQNLPTELEKVYAKIKECIEKYNSIRGIDYQCDEYYAPLLAEELKKQGYKAESRYSPPEYNRDYGCEVGGGYYVDIEW